MTWSNAIVLQSGGPTAVINSSLYGVHSEWLNYRKGMLYGSRFGVEGILNKNLVELNGIQLNFIGTNPSAALGSSRYNLWQDNSNLKTGALARMLEIFDFYRIGYVFLIGGDDSRKNAYAIAKFSSQARHRPCVFHIPKTIDNDLTHTHHCPGYASAAQYIVWAVSGLELESKAMLGVTIDIVMGRNTGWLAAASVLVKNKNSSKANGPHYIYVPEADFTTALFLSDVEEALKRNNRAHIVVSEGIAEKPAIRTYAREAGVEKFALALSGKDDFNHVQLSGTGLLGALLSHMVRTRLKIKRVRVNTFDYTQRCFPAQSKLDLGQAFEVGRMAVKTAITEKANNIMVAIGTDQLGYNDQIKFVPLGEVFNGNTNQSKTLPQELLETRNQISREKFREYIGGLIDFPAIEWSNPLI